LPNAAFDEVKDELLKAKTKISESKTLDELMANSEFLAKASSKMAQIITKLPPPQVEELKRIASEAGQAVVTVQKKLGF
jgi:phage shock protein A